MYFLPRTLRKIYIYISITFSILLLKEILAKLSYLYNVLVTLKFTRVECKRYSENLSRYSINYAIE